MENHLGFAEGTARGKQTGEDLLNGYGLKGVHNQYGRVDIAVPETGTQTLSR